MIAKKGFTLMELLMVVLIIAVLASIVVPRMSGAVATAKDAKDDANWANLIRALENYAGNNDGKYPADQAAFEADIVNNKTYFPHGAPECPYGEDYVYDATAGQETIAKHPPGSEHGSGSSEGSSEPNE